MHFCSIKLTIGIYLNLFLRLPVNYIPIFFDQHTVLNLRVTD